MNKYIKVKNIVIAILCLTVILMAAGFVVLSIKLDNMVNEKNNFEVIFKSAKQASSLKGGEKDPFSSVKVTSSGAEIEMEFVLYEPHDDVTYDLIVQNNGTVNASIIDLLVSPDFSDKNIAKTYNPISVNVTNIAGKILAPGEEATVKVNVFYTPTEDALLLGPHSIKGKIGIIAKTATK